MKPPKKRATPRSRINIPALLIILRHLARQGGVASPELRDLTGLSRPTLTRLLADAEAALGVRITWHPDMSLPSHGEYRIEDWGMLNPRRILARRR